MNVVIYARVSSLTQDLDLQIKEIERLCNYKKFNIIKTFTDKQSGKDMNRPGFKDMIEFLSTNKIDAIIIHKLDRIGRSLKDLLKFAEWIKSNNIQLISVTDNIDTTTVSGYLSFQIMGAMAEYERHIINERTELGRKEAIEKGIRFGRPIKDIPIDLIQKDIASGIPKSVICKKYNIKRSTLYKKLNSPISDMDGIEDVQTREIVQEDIKEGMEDHTQYIKDDKGVQGDGKSIKILCTPVNHYYY